LPKLKQRLNIPDRLINLISGPALLAIPVAIVVIILVDLEFSPYVAEVSETINSVEEFKVSSYVDINGDRKNERLYTYNYRTNAAVIAYTIEGALFESYNLKGFWYMSPEYDIYDFDQDRISELYGITITSDDSVYVNCIEFNPHSNENKTQFVAKIGRHYGERDVIIESLGFSDITGDRLPDYLFSITAGFTLQPRAVYAWDIARDTILRSPFAGMAIKDIYHVPKFDLDNDGIDELFFLTSSTDNYQNDVPYSDTATYAPVLTRDLRFFFDPPKMAGRSSRTVVFPWVTSSDTMVMALVNDRRNDVHIIHVYTLDLLGNIIKSNSIPSRYVTNFIYQNSRVYLYSQDGNEKRIGYINEDLGFTEITRYEANFGRLIPLNIDIDPEKEFLAIDHSKNELMIIQDGFISTTTVSLPEHVHAIEDISLVLAGEIESVIHLQGDKFRCYITYRKNNLYYLKIPYYLGIYILFFIVLHLLQRIFIYRNERRKITEERMLNLQLQSMMNQLNPHFTFNALNTIGDSVLEGPKEEAYEYFSKLSDLIRSSMTNAFQLDKSLEEEIAFVKQYMELEELRFRERLTFSATIHPSVDLSIKIPKMLIHIFVENAVKHGIFHKIGPGEINLTVNSENGAILIRIEDNGIGREAASRLVTSPGKGLKILDNYLYLYSKSHGLEIQYEIEDSEPGQSDPGTSVTIHVAN
jgi:hypothetical protein